MMMLIQKLVRPVQNVEGATAIEYGLIASIVSVAMIAGLQIVGPNLNAVFTYVGGLLVAP